jgi:hypothetical protein
MKKLVSWALATCLLASCVSRPPAETAVQGRTLKLDPKKAVTNLPFSELFAELQLINLQQPGNALIDEIQWIDAQRDTLYLRVGGGVLVANRLGHGLTPIGKKGEGPGEYKRFLDAYPAPNGRLTLLTLGKLLTYSPGGNLLAERKYPSAPSQLAEWKGKYFFYYANFITQSKHALAAIDKQQLATLDEWLPITQNQAKYLHISGNNCLSVVNDTLVLAQPFCDTVYQMSNYPYLQPRYVIDFGQYAIPGEFFRRPHADIEVFLTAVRREERYCFLKNNFIENGRFLSFSFEYKLNRYQFYLNKATGQQWLAKGHLDDVGNTSLPLSADYENAPRGYDEAGAFFVVEPSELLAAMKTNPNSPLFKQLGQTTIDPQGNPLLIYAKFKP